MWKAIGVFLLAAALVTLISKVIPGFTVDTVLGFFGDVAGRAARGVINFLGKFTGGLAGA